MYLLANTCFSSALTKCRQEILNCKQLAQLHSEKPQGQWQLEEAILNPEISSISTMQDFQKCWMFLIFLFESNNRSRTTAAEHLSRDILQTRVTENSSRALRQLKIPLDWLRLTASSITNFSPVRDPEHTLRFWHHDQRRGGSLRWGRRSPAPVANNRCAKGLSIWGMRGVLRCATKTQLIDFCAATDKGRKARRVDRNKQSRTNLCFYRRSIV